MRYVVSQKREDRIASGRLTNAEILAELTVPHTVIGLGEGLILIDVAEAPPPHPRLWIEEEILYHLAHP